jgi:hypothetical protein
MTTHEIPEWVPVTTEHPVNPYDINFALCLNGVVQQIMTVPLSTASLIMANPTYVQVPMGAQPGMTIEEALAITTE